MADNANFYARVAIRSLYCEMQATVKPYSWPIEIHQAAPDAPYQGKVKTEFKYREGIGWANDILYLYVPPYGSLYNTLIFVHEVDHALHCAGIHPLQDKGLFQDVLSLPSGLEDKYGHKLPDDDKEIQVLRHTLVLQGELAATSFTCYQVIQRELWRTVARDENTLELFHQLFCTIVRCQKFLRDDDISVSRQEAMFQFARMMNKVLPHVSPEKRRIFLRKMNCSLEIIE